jgi:hypothetical protein
MVTRVKTKSVTRLSYSGLCDGLRATRGRCRVDQTRELLQRAAHKSL